MPSSRQPWVLEINTRCWLNERSASEGRRITLKDIPESAVAEWAAMGWTHVWLMGVWPTGPKSRSRSLQSKMLRQRFDEVLPDWTEDDVPGSPYAISEYKVGRFCGGATALKSFRRLLHRHGLKLILDFIPNHLGLDHPWLKQHPEYFVQNPKTSSGTVSVKTGGSGTFHICQGRDPYFAPWNDTTQLDIRRQDTREALRRELSKVADLCDGVRCDMAMLLLNGIFRVTWKDNPCTASVCPDEFWPDTIDAIKKQHPDFLFIAEVYWNREESLHRIGFDYCYRKRMVDHLKEGDAPGLREMLQTIPSENLAKGCWFLENHDEPRAASLFEAPLHRTVSLLMVSLPGMKLFHEGQTLGWRNQIPVQLGRRPIENGDPDIKAHYTQLLSIFQKQRIDSGTATLLTSRPAWEENETFRQLILIQWQEQEDSFFLSVINPSSEHAQCYTSLTAAGLARHDWKMEDLLGHEQYIRHGPEMAERGLYLDVPEYAAQLFEFTPVR